MISIHALREESDAFLEQLKSDASNFNPRPPRGERQRIANPRVCNDLISIHALREESDSIVLINFFDLLYFNPRPPRGERLRICSGQTSPSTFQSTPSARRATV